MRFIVLFIIETFVLHVFVNVATMCCRPYNHYNHYNHYTETFHFNIQWLSIKPEIIFHQKFFYGVIFWFFFPLAYNRNLIRSDPIRSMNISRFLVCLEAIEPNCLAKVHNYRLLFDRELSFGSIQLKISARILLAYNFNSKPILLEL